jgi:hypothetical protein
VGTRGPAAGAWELSAQAKPMMTCATAHAQEALGGSQAQWYAHDPPPAMRLAPASESAVGRVLIVREGRTYHRASPSDLCGRSLVPIDRMALLVERSCTSVEGIIRSTCPVSAKPADSHPCRLRGFIGPLILEVPPCSLSQPHLVSPGAVEADLQRSARPGADFRFT